MEEAVRHSPPSRAARKVSRLALAVVLGALLAVAGIYAYRHYAGLPGPVPKSIRSALAFPVYYPEQRKLPAGYRLDSGSFRLAEEGVLLFSVSSSHGKQLIFSEETSPGQEVINKFNTLAIPLHTPLYTALGQANVGAYGSGSKLQTIVSLPISHGPWLIVTAPANIGQDTLKQVLQSLTR